MIRIKFWNICIIYMFLWLQYGSTAAGDDMPLSFSLKEFDLGSIAEDGGIVSHTFLFTNVSDKPVVIYQVTSFCKCTEAEFSKDEILPGKTGEILVRFNPMGYQGQFKKSVRVITSAGSAFLISLKGTIIPKKKTLEEQYPINLSGNVRISGDEFSFRSVVQGRPKTKILEYANTSSDTVELDISYICASGYLNVDGAGQVLPYARGKVTFEYNLPHKVYGVCNDTLQISVKGASLGRQVVLSCVGIEDFTDADLENSPKAVLDKQYFNMGNVGLAKKNNCVFSIRNDGKSNLYIRSIKCSKHLSTDLSKETIVAPGKTLTFGISLDTLSVPVGKFIGTMLLTTNDPVRPMREIMIIADKSE